MIVDYHMHLRNSAEEIEHTVEAIELFVEIACERGVDEIGFTEHVYYFTATRSLWDVPYQLERCNYELEPYVDAVDDAKSRGLPVKLGLEVDYVPGREDDLRDVLAPYPWDYLLGSVHFVDGLSVDGAPELTDELGVERAWDRYFDVLADAAASGLFDSLSHPDLVKIFGRRPARAATSRVHAAFVSRVAATTVALEVSSAGLHKPVGEVYPDLELLALARRSGVPITLASDAHVPANVGRDLDRGVDRARAAGYTTVTVFDARVARQEPLG